MSLGPGTSALTPTIVDPPRVPIEVDTVRRQFDRRAQDFAKSDFIVREVARRMIERLDVIRLDPARIADVGCGNGASLALLRTKYPRADWIGIDLSPAMLRRHAGRTLAERARRWMGRSSAFRICAEAGALPLVDGSLDLVLSNLMLHWHPEPHILFPEWKRLLKNGGLLMFSGFGPDTGKELRSAAMRALPHARPLPFIDMHDYGDMMTAAGFSTPVMDVETIRLTFASASALLREVRALGGNPRRDRVRGLASGAQARAFYAALDAGPRVDGRLTLTFEVAFGHAWKAPPRERPTKTAQSVISMDRLREQLRGR